MFAIESESEITPKIFDRRTGEKKEGLWLRRSCISLSSKNKTLAIILPSQNWLSGEHSNPLFISRQRNRVSSGLRKRKFAQELVSSKMTSLVHQNNSGSRIFTNRSFNHYSFSDLKHFQGVLSDCTHAEYPEEFCGKKVGKNLASFLITEEKELSDFQQNVYDSLVKTACYVSTGCCFERNLYRKIL